MSGSYIHIPPKRHMCDLPNCDDPIGTVWRCDECGWYWQRKEVYVGFGCQREWCNDFWRNAAAALGLGWLT